MKRYLPLLLIPVLLLAGPACRKNKKDLTAAIITGMDGRYCLHCCGGYMITFTDDPQPYKPPFKLISNDISSVIGDNPTFPMYVDIAYSIDSTKCSGAFIIISKLIKK